MGLRDLLKFATVKDPDVKIERTKSRRRGPQTSTKCGDTTKCPEGHDHTCTSDWHNRGNHRSTEKGHKWEW